MTTLAQDGLPQDTDVLRTLVHHNRAQVGDLGRFPCAGVYAVVAPQEQYGLVIAWYSTELEKVSFESGAVLKHPFVSALAERRAARPAQIVLLRSARRIGD
jgi:hypothetical protein